MAKLTLLYNPRQVYLKRAITGIQISQSFGVIGGLIG